MHATPALKDRRQRVVGICVVAATLVLAPLTGGTALAAPERNHCITPAGTDANEVLGVAEQLVLYDDECGPVSTGESWIPLGVMSWMTNTFFEVVPPGYEPSAATPMEDFLSKAETITYVVDAGTKRERTYRYRVEDIVKVDTIDEFVPLWSQPYPIAQFVAKLPPLPPGQHTVHSVLQMSGRSCDGFGTEGSSCIGPDVIVCGPMPFTVEKRTAARPT